MKKMRLVTSAILVIMMLAVPSAYADTIAVGNTIQLYDSYGSSPGGAFALYKGSTYQFETFCLELNEWFNFGDNLIVEGITKEAKNGGVGGAVNGVDPLDDRTAYLYYTFRMNTLGSLVSGFYYANSTSYTALQQAIWYIEGETTTLSSVLAYKLYYAANTASSAARTTAYNNVSVLNLKHLDGSNSQDVITLASVPEPATMLLLGLGLIGLAGVRRMFKSVN